MARYIDADLLIKCADDCLAHEEDTTDMIRIINDLPTADVQEVKHGHWIKDPESGITRCSECDWSLDVAWESSYCPDCGAKMYEEVTK